MFLIIYASSPRTSGEEAMWECGDRLMIDSLMMKVSEVEQENSLDQLQQARQQNCVQALWGAGSVGRSCVGSQVVMSCSYVNSSLDFQQETGLELK